MPFTFYFNRRLKDADAILEKVGEGTAYFFYDLEEYRAFALIYRNDGTGYVTAAEPQDIKALEHELHLEDGWKYLKPEFD